MDKGKNRTDLLAAGRKKLQQFRQKKDHKGGGKSSSSKSGKAEKDADSEEPVISVQSDAVDTQPPSSDSVVSLDHQEANRSGLEQCDDEVSGVGMPVIESGKDYDDESGSVPVAVDDGMEENHVANVLVPSSEDKMAHMVNGLSAPAEESQWGERGVEVGTTSLEYCDNEVSRIGMPVIESGKGGDDESGSAPVALVDDGMKEDHVADVLVPSSEDKVAHVLNGLAAPAEESQGGERDVQVGTKSLEQCDNEVLGIGMPVIESGKDDDDDESGSVPVAQVDDGMKEDHAAIVLVPSSDDKVAKVVNGLSAPAEENRGGERGVEVGTVSLEMGVFRAENGGAERSSVLEDHEMDNGAQQFNLSLISKEAAEMQEKEHSYELEDSTSHGENLGESSSFTHEYEICDVGLSANGQGEATGHGKVLLHVEEVRSESDVITGVVEGEAFSHEEKGEESNSTSLAGPSSVQDYGLHVESFDDGLDTMKTHLYLSFLAEELLQLQLAEQADLNMEFCRHSSDEMLRLGGLVKHTQESKAMVSEELTQCRTELQDMAIRNENLEVRYLATKEEAKQLNNKAGELQSRLESTQEDLAQVLAELASCRSSLEALQRENLDLTASLILGEDARKKLVEEDFFQIENTKLASDLLEQKERLLGALDIQVQLEGSARESEASYDQIIGENLFLSNCLDVHQATMKELFQKYYQLSFESREAGTLVNISNLDAMAPDKAVEGPKIFDEKCDIVVGAIHEQGPSLEKFDDGEPGESAIPEVLKRHLEEAEKVLQSLETSIQGMHSHSVSLGKSGGRVAASGVSKLIQAFESKRQQEDNISDEVPLTDGECLGPSYLLTRVQSESLRSVLKQMAVDLAKPELCFQEDLHRRKFCQELEAECETHRKQNNLLQAQIVELAQKQLGYISRIDDLHNVVNKVWQNANNEVERLLTLVDSLHKEVDDKASVLKQEMRSIEDVVFEAIAKLDASTGMLNFGGSDLGSHVTVSVDAALKEIQSLHEQIESAHMDQKKLELACEEVNQLFSSQQKKNKLAARLLNRIYSNLRELGGWSSEDAEDVHMDFNDEELLQALPEKYEVLITTLRKLLDERFNLQATCNVLEIELSDRNKEVDDTSKRYNELLKKSEGFQDAVGLLEAALVKKSEEFEELNGQCLALVMKLEDYKLNEDADLTHWFNETKRATLAADNINRDASTSSLQRLEALVGYHLERYEEAIAQIRLAKNYLREVSMQAVLSVKDWSLPLHSLLKQNFVPAIIELKEVQGELPLLSATNLQLETEIQVLKEGFCTMKESLDMAHTELQLKVSELEQSEQKLSSVREKLSIAVAKGKGLIVQRDSLKQSLMEKSSELEKCRQELLSTEELLHEVEAKLKSYSEVDRVEALESELSYIRNSATSLRESFLLKDSVLQRIEEVLEDLDMPEHFHAKDIVEKIEFLSRSATASSSIPLSDWDQKSTVGGSHSDTRSIVVGAWKDDLPPSSNSGLDDLRRKYEEIQSRFYGLAEHNDMLEQSLMERNSYLQKLEEVLDRIDMPPQLRIRDPEDRIEWLGRTLSEVLRERNALQLKIDNLEVSADMLIVDVEESHKKISELSAEIAAVTSEKDFFSESLGKLRFEYLSLSEKAVQDELDRDNLRKELIAVQEKSVEKDHGDVEREIQKLLDLVNDALADEDRSNASSSHSALACLEESLRKLIDKCAAVSFERPVRQVAEDMTVESSKNPHEMLSGDILDDKEQDIVALRSELDEAYNNMALIKEERDSAMEECSSLISELDVITKQRNLIQEERAEDMEKYQSLVSEVEALAKQRDALREQLTVEEQKSASAREKLNVAVRKGKGLVQQRDSLKQTIEEMNTMVEHSKSQHNQQMEALESERSLLVKQVEETERNLEDSNQTLHRLLTALDAIDVRSESTFTDPGQKVEGIRKFIDDLYSSAVSSEHEAKKSKRAADLLLAELNEVQERADILQEDLGKAEARLLECAKEKVAAEAAKVDAFSHLEHAMEVHSAEIKKLMANLVNLKSLIDHLRHGSSGFSRDLENVLTKDMDFICYVKTFMEFILKHLNGENVADQSVLASKSLFSIDQMSKKSHEIGAELEVQMQGDDQSLVSDHLTLANYSLHQITGEIDDMKENIREHSVSFLGVATYLEDIMVTIRDKLAVQRDFSETTKRDVTGLELMIKEKDTEIHSLHRNLSLLYEACGSSIVELENKIAQINGTSEAPPVGESLGNPWAVLKPSSYDYGSEPAGGRGSPFTEDSTQLIADSLLSRVKRIGNRNEIEENNQRELKATIFNLQRELQEKDIQMSRMCEELVSQIREAESAARTYLIDLDSARAQANDLEHQLEDMEQDRKSLESRLSQFDGLGASLEVSQAKITSLSDALTAKDQEIEALMQALDEEESQMEVIEDRKRELENLVQEKILALESIEASRAKAVAKLSTTVNKFDELHVLSESLLAEVENLESQLQLRDSEISFLRQEVTRCTNDALAAEETNKQYSGEINELRNWMSMMALRLGAHEPHRDDEESSQIHNYTDIIEKNVVSTMAELDDIRLTAQSKDALLQIERGRVEELLRKVEAMESSLHKKGTQIELLGVRKFGESASMNSQGHLEIEQIRNKVSSGAITPHVRSGRKVNGDQIAIAIDTELDENVLDDDDDDKAHGFKSLIMSRVVPRAIRPIADRVDAIWVSGDRLLMRQPTLRLGVLLYWIAVHALLASFI